MMKTLGELEKRMIRIREEVDKIRDMRPGSVSRQFKNPGTKTGAYYQLSYTHKMKSCTEYVSQEQLQEVRRQTAEFRRFRKLIDTWIDLAIEHARLKSIESLKRSEKMVTSKKQNEVKELIAHITLQEINPPVWRKIRLSSDMTLDQLHYAIQGAFGWTNSHLHSFTVSRDQRYSSNPINFEEGDDIDACTVTLNDLLNKNHKRFLYQYDFGDSWEHEIIIEDIKPVTKPIAIPECIAGERHCPPEDCGGVGGFENFVQAMTNKKHPEHKEMKEWFGGPFNPEKFSLEMANKTIKSLQKYTGTRL